MSNRSPYEIDAPTPNQTFVAATADVVFKGTREKGVRVPVEILMKGVDGIYRKINIPNVKSKVEISGADKKTTAEHNFGKAFPGEYLIEYKFAKTKNESGNWIWGDTGRRVEFKVTQPSP